VDVYFGEEMAVEVLVMEFVCDLVASNCVLGVGKGRRLASVHGKREAIFINTFGKYNE
jgi:hypothetical protein